MADEQGHNSKPYDIPGVVPVTSEKWQDRIGDVSWGAAFPMILSWMWKHYGDRRIVAELYDVSKSYVDFLEAESLATSNTSLVSFFIWGDWCSMQNRVVATKASGGPLSGFNFILSL